MNPSAFNIPINILLVDDRPEDLIALENVLADLKYTLVKATSGEEALRCLLVQDFALIQLDVQMEGLNGYETAQLIRSRERSASTPIILFTTHRYDTIRQADSIAVLMDGQIAEAGTHEELERNAEVFWSLYLKDNATPVPNFKPK